MDLVIRSDRLISLISLGWWFGLYSGGGDDCWRKAGKDAVKILQESEDLEENIDGQQKKEELYKMYWNHYTRVMSTIHAVGCVILSVIYIYLHYPNFLEFDFNRIDDSACKLMFITCAWMVSYLLIDLLFMITEKTEDNPGMWIIHHVLGIIGMFCFAYYGILGYKGIYYALTEVTTIFINISWFMIKSKSNEKGLGKIIFLILGGLAWLLWLIVRVGGIPILIWLVIRDFDLIVELSIFEIFMVFIANPIIYLLNVIWFFKLTLVVFGLKSIEQMDQKEKKE